MELILICIFGSRPDGGTRLRLTGKPQDDRHTYTRRSTYIHALKMGCNTSTLQDPGQELDPFLQSKHANDLIEGQLQAGGKAAQQEVKLLLLGAGESGKSTVLKQLRLLHHGGFSHQERRQYAQVLWADTVQSMRVLIVQARKLGISLECDDPGNSELCHAKQLVMRCQPLAHIDAAAAGGREFLSEYVVRYSERSERTRRAASTGRARALEDSNETGEQDNASSAIPELSQLAEAADPEAMFLRNTSTASSAQPAPAEVASAIQLLWGQDTGIAQCYARANEFQLEGSAAYYFAHALDFAQPDYACTDQDILQGRVKTTGITETEFHVGGAKLRVLDAGGQRSERRKWIHCFQDITAVCFVAAASEYDQALFEDARVNRMRESVMLFETLVNSKWFRDTPFILFLNKTDLFAQKIARSPLRAHFPEYTGRVGDVEAGLAFLESKFVSLARGTRAVYVRRTCATDRETMRFVLGAVTDMVVQQNLKRSGLL
ncbi:hypothetical protein TBLA_0C00870 [Henningerozyma blattae CBS 6284]|uniref:Guanine nucleotide-binding protein subunit alpha n=1 Tax=Henningerozyma blattae (strain ATCC 34711 / CBS 6284 / DSM 70876 / NBRC 10599 / NRRL Y-10934 / UCD 77-7) TaxID=1071380 RepID=I2H0J9_HENB6|nr:hypothetical protein TBLA_0C00870 [Tetrapisispora blattae CBS 6284]CCH59901.1 hypothetical protein TBLA_0C00870 [Tetrapisispora blattae CBS 6284]